MVAQRAGHQVVGGTVENGNPDHLIAWAGYLGEFREWLPVGEPRLVEHVPTCNISYRRSIFARFGGFPVEFYPQEDLLFHWWLAQHGVPIWFDPQIRVRHVHRASWGAYVRHLERIGRITARVLKLTGGEGAFLARSPVLALMAAPFLPMVKTIRTIEIFARQQPLVLRTALLCCHFWQGCMCGHGGSCWERGRRRYRLPVRRRCECEVEDDLGADAWRVIGALFNAEGFSGFRR